MKVDFMVIGAARSATTSLSSLLALHPEICFSTPKEPQFFSQDNWRNSLEEYHTLFKNEAKLYGEGSTNYSKYPHFNKNIFNDIFEYNPDMKFIYMMRNPIDRIISHYKLAIERGYASEDINAEVLQKPIYIDTSKYFYQISPYIELFGSKNIKLVLFEEYINSHQNVLNKVFDFLGVSRIDISSKYAVINQSQAGTITHEKYDYPSSLLKKILKGFHVLSRRLKPVTIDISLNEETKQKLISELSEDIKNLETLINKDLSHWLLKQE